MVYKHLFAELVLTRERSFGLEPLRGYPAVLHCGKAIRNDALPLFYELATFRLGEIDIEDVEGTNDSLRRLWRCPTPSLRLLDRDEHRFLQQVAIDIDFKLEALVTGLPLILDPLQSLKILNFGICLSPEGEFHVERVEAQYLQSGRGPLPWNFESIRDGTATQAERRALRMEIMRLDLDKDINVLKMFAWWAQEFRRFTFKVTIDFFCEQFFFLNEDVDTDDALEMPGFRAIAVLTKDGIKLLEEYPITKGDSLYDHVARSRDLEREWFEVLSDALGYQG